jgi:glycosyltransferase involved in cell wall biosynthesis
MHLLYAVGRPAFPFFIGGDGTIAHTILTELTRAAIDCRYLGTFGDHVVNKLPRLDELTVSYELDGNSLRYALPYPVTLASEAMFSDVVDKTIAELRPDIVLSQLDWSCEILAAAKRYGCRTALYVLDVDNAENFRALEAGVDVILAVSEFVRRELRRRFAIQSHVLYPLLDLGLYRSARREEFVTMINPVAVKGAEIALSLAASLPDQQFLFVDGWGTSPALLERIEHLPNVTYMPKQLDMRTVYSRTRILLVPSQWQEAFGRVVLEAQASGIPVVASRTGGLPEAVGDGGILIDDYTDPDRWLTVLQELLKDRSACDDLSRKAVENVKRFSLEHELQRLIGILGNPAY